MNAIERVFAAFRGERADRRAFSMVLSLYGARLTDCPLDAYYTSPERYVAGQRAVVDLCDPDILFTPFAMASEARSFGCELVHFTQGPSNVKKPACKGLADLASLRQPDLRSDPDLVYLVESTKRLADIFGRDKPIAAVLTAPVDLPALLVGIDQWMEALLFEPAKRDELVRRTTAHFVALANAMLEAGASCVVTPVMFANPRLVTPEIARQRVIPLLAQAYAQVRGPVIFHHGGNTLARFLEHFKGMPGVAGFALDQRDSFAEARTILGEEPVLFGNLSGPHLPGMTPQQAAERTRSILAERADDPRFIFCTANADVPWGTPPETIRAVRDAVLAFGRGQA